MADTQATKAAETTRAKQKTEDRPPPEREYAPSALAATLFRAAGSDDPTTPPDHLTRVVGRLTAPHQAGFLLQCQRRYGNAYVQRMISSRDNGHSPLERQAHTQEEPTARQITAPDVATAYAERTSPSGVLQNPVGQAKPLIVSIAPIVRRQKTKDDDEDKRVQSESAAPPAGGFDAGEELETRLSQSKGGGNPLPDSVRTFMEPRFGVDFGRVRVHTGNDAIQMNRDVSAQAFTHGADIYYGAGSSPTNLQLTAHELTHVVQQTGGAPLQMKKQAPHSMGTLEPAVPPEHGGVVQRQEQDEGPGFVETLAWNTLESLAPNLAPLARKGPEGVFDWIKERASDAAAGVFDTLMAPVRAVADVGAKLSEQFMPLVATLQDAMTKIASNDCTPLQQAAAKIEHIAEQIITPIIEFVQPIVAKIQDFLGLVWDKLGAPIWEWIQQYASQRWQEIKQLASWIWDIVEPISKLGKEAWEWLKKTIGIGEGPEGENGILQWLQGKLQAAWDWVKQQLEPFSKQLTVIKAVIVEVAQIVSPEGPVRAILAVASQAASGIGWLKDNFGSGDAIVKARVYLENTLLPPLAGALKKLGDTVTGLAGSVSAALSKLANSMLQAVAAASGSVVAFAASAVQWIADQISALAGWANQQLTSLAQMLQSALGTLLGFVNTFLEFLGKVGTVILDVWGLPLFLAGKVWNWVPACIRDPIVDFVIPIILRQIELFEELVRDNEAWQKTKAAVTKLIRQVFVDHDLMGALKGTFNLILRTFNIPPDLAVTVAQKALAAWDIVVKQPLEFIKNTVRALGHGFKLLWANITDHLEYGIKGWLLGSIADKDIQFPKDWTKPREVFGFVMDVLGLNVSHIFELLKKRINPTLVTKAQTWLTRFQGAWDWITSMIDTSKSPAENTKGVMDKAKDFGKSILTGVVEWIAGKVAQELAILAAAAAASGGLSEVVDIARRIYKAMVSAKRWAGQILQMANETLDDITAIASGAVEKAGGKFKDIMHKGMPVVIGFLADQVGLGGVGPAMRNIIDKLREKVDEAVLWLIDKIKAGIEAIIGAVKAGVGTIIAWWNTRRSFTARDGKPHELYFRGQGASAALMMASDTPRSLESVLSDPNLVIENADVLSRRLKNLDEKIAVFARKPAPTDEERNAFQREVETEVAELATALAKYLGHDASLPATAVTYSVGAGGRPTRVRAEPLTLNPGNTTGQPSTGSRSHVVGIDVVSHWEQKTGAHTRGDALTPILRSRVTATHVLSAKLHGPFFSPWNVVLTDQSLNNRMQAPEGLGVKNFTTAKLMYEVVVEYYNDQPPPLEALTLEEAEVEDVKRWVGYYIGKSFRVSIKKWQDNAYTDLYSDVVPGDMPPVVGQTVPSLPERIVAILKTDVVRADPVMIGAVVFFRTGFSTRRLRDELGVSAVKLGEALQALYADKVLQSEQGAGARLLIRSDRS